MELILRIIYTPFVNYVLRNTVKLFRKILPSKLQIPPSGIFNFHTGNNRYIRIATNPTCHVTSQLYWKGTYEYDQVFKVLIGDAKIFFDVGANIGYFSLLAASQNPNIQVYAFDPSPGPFYYLTKNIKLNGFEKNIYAFATALSDSVGSVEFILAYRSKYSFMKHNTLGGAGHISGLRPDTSSQKVIAPTDTIDHFVETHGIKQIDFIKLDAEEAEHLILAGATQSIRKFRPIIACEVFDDRMEKLLDQIILSIDYKAFLFKGKGFAALDKMSGQTTETMRDCFFVPHEKISVMAPFII